MTDQIPDRIRDGCYARICCERAEDGTLSPDPDQFLRELGPGWAKRGESVLRNGLVAVEFYHFDRLQFGWSTWDAALPRGAT